MTIDPLQARNGNALKHGLSSKSHFPHHAQQLIAQIELDLDALYQPESDKERHALQELAVAYWQNQETDRFHQARIEKEARIAANLYDHQQIEKFHENQKLWNNSPQFARDLLGNTSLGALFFEKIWSDIAGSLESLNSQREMTLEQAWNAAQSEKSFADVARISSEGLWIFARFLALSNDPEAEISDWIERSHASSSKSAARQANQYRNHAPDPETAKMQLLAMAKERSAFWSDKARQLNLENDYEKTQFCQNACGLGLGNSKLMNEAQLALRYRNSTQVRVDKAIRRIEALQKGRELNRHRLLQANEREARRHERLNHRPYNLSEIENWEALQVQKNGPVPSAYESIQQRNLYESGFITDPETETDVETDAKTDSVESVQYSTVQSFEPKKQNEHETTGAMSYSFMTWPDSEFRDPNVKRARVELQKITNESEAEQYCIHFNMELNRRRSKQS